MRNSITGIHSKAAIAHFIGDTAMFSKANHDLHEAIKKDQVKYFVTLAWMSHKKGMQHQMSEQPALAMSAFAVRDLHMKKARESKNVKK